MMTAKDEHTWPRLDHVDYWTTMTDLDLDEWRRRERKRDGLTVVQWFTNRDEDEGSVALVHEQG